jgi:hypothetical protein
MYLRDIYNILLNLLLNFIEMVKKFNNCLNFLFKNCNDFNSKFVHVNDYLPECIQIITENSRLLARFGHNLFLFTIWAQFDTFQQSNLCSKVCMYKF